MPGVRRQALRRKRFCLSGGTGKNISDILSLSVEEAMEMFAAERRLAARLHTLCGAGLGYLELGQTLTTLSGGEGQRLKLAKELMEQAQNNVLYLMDEPTVGLHPLDVEHFLALLNGMVEGGATVIAVEHNQQVISASDWVVELGPGGGVDGGRAVFSGTPQELAACTESCNRTFFWKAVALNKLKTNAPARIAGAFVLRLFKCVYGSFENSGLCSKCGKQILISLFQKM